MKNELSHGNTRENLSIYFCFYSPFVLPSHLVMHSKLVEVVQLLHLVKLTLNQLTFSLWKDLIIIINGVFIK